MITVLSQYNDFYRIYSYVWKEISATSAVQIVRKLVLCDYDTLYKDFDNLFCLRAAVKQRNIFLYETRTPTSLNNSEFISSV